MAANMPRILIQNGRVIDPSQQLDRTTNVLVEDGRIAAYDASPSGQDDIIDAAGKIVAPGLIDMHVHLREPGLEEDETIETGTAAALAGGFTSVACLADTQPPIDSPAAVEFIHLQAERAGHCNVFVIACATKSREGNQLAEIGHLVRAGAVAFSDADASLYDANIMRRALEYSAMFGKPVFNHCEVDELAKGGVMHEGMVSMLLGLPGIPDAAEKVMVGRDIVLSEGTGGHVHIMHISSAESIELVRRAKSRGSQVTTEVCPHHFTLTDERVRTFDSNYKVSPPLRAVEDVEACIQGLIDGTIDCIVSDHSPHAPEKKMQELDRAPFGVVGLETTLPVVISELIAPGHLDWMAALAKMTIHPARILGIDRGTLEIGKPADVTIIDPDIEWKIDPDGFRSKSKNTCFAGRPVQGRADTVLVAGQVKYRAPQPAAL